MSLAHVGLPPAVPPLPASARTVRFMTSSDEPGVIDQDVGTLRVLARKSGQRERLAQMMAILVIAPISGPELRRRIGSPATASRKYKNDILIIRKTHNLTCTRTGSMMLYFLEPKTTPR